jgi:CIC family chloride channel protein
MKLSDLKKIKLLNKLDEESVLMTLTLFTGAASGATAVFIMNAIHWITNHFHTLQSPTFSSTAFSLFCILLAGYITTRIDPNVSGSGIPRTKIHYTVNHGIIKFKESILKLITTILSLGSGFSLGREGPTLAITAGLGSSVAQFLHLSKLQTKTLLAVGSTAGIAAAFNTPIAAVTFTLEEIVGNMNAKSLGPIIIGSVAAAVTALLLTGGDATFHIDQYQFNDPLDLIFYFGLGLITAILGPTWIKMILKLRETRITLFKGHRLSYLMTVSMLLFIFAFYNVDVLGSGHHVINELLKSNEFTLNHLAVLFLLKFIFIALCYSTGLSGGIFMPSLLMGALVGGMLGLLGKEYFDLQTQVGAFALVGMGAFFSSVIRTPITSILMIFELTQDYRIMLPLMIANMTSYYISSRIMKNSIYEQLAEQDGVHLPSKEDHETLEQLTVEEAMKRSPHVLQWNTTVAESMTEINQTEFSGFPVIKAGKLIGIVSKKQIATNIIEHHEDVTVGSICTKKLITIYPDQSLLLALHYLEKYKVSRLLVVSRLNERMLRGIITAGDIVERFGIHIQEDNEQDMHLDIVIKDRFKNSDQDNQE